MRFLLSFLLLVYSLQLPAQSDEAKQLMLNLEKLSQFKKILQQMKTGYQILHKGYTSIKNISEGDFNLHRDFLQGLFEINPAVKNYKKVAEIIRYQHKIVKEATAALQQFKGSGQFRLAEIDYLQKVYGNLLQESLKKLDELLMVLTAGKLRMTDDERLRVIDQVFDDIIEQYGFLNQFNNRTAILSVQREKEQMEIELMKKIHGQ